MAIKLVSDFNIVAAVTRPVAAGATINEGDLLVVENGAFRVATAADAGKVVHIAFGYSDSYDVSEAGVITGFYGPSRWRFGTDKFVDVSALAAGDKLKIAGNQFDKWEAPSTYSATDFGKICGTVVDVTSDYVEVVLY